MERSAAISNGVEKRTDINAMIQVVGQGTMNNHTATIIYPI